MHEANNPIIITVSNNISYNNTEENLNDLWVYVCLFVC